MVLGSLENSLSCYPDAPLDNVSINVRHYGETVKSSWLTMAAVVPESMVIYPFLENSMHRNRCHIH